MANKNITKEEMNSLIKEFKEKYCPNCSSYIFCAGEMIMSCNDFNKFLFSKGYN